VRWQALQHRGCGRPGAAAEAFGLQPVRDRVAGGADIERLQSRVGRGSDLTYSIYMLHIPVATIVLTIGGRLLVGLMRRWRAEPA